MVSIADDAQALDDAIITSDPLAWFETYGWILDKSGTFVNPTANILQERVCEAVRYCVENKLPARIIQLKPRQKGSSTIAVGLLYWFLRQFTYQGVIIGGEFSQSDNLWKICRRYATRDQFPWANGCEPGERLIKFAHGAEISKETGRDREAGRSGTYQCCVITELARWAEQGVANAKEVVTGLLATVPRAPGTLVIMDSTARGPSGVYYDRWQGAVTLEEFKAGKRGNGYIKVFAAWHEFDDSFLEFENDRQRARFIDSMGTPEMVNRYGDEVELMGRLNLAYEQVWWRRFTIDDECDRDPRIFDREYPESPEGAFHASIPSFFNVQGLKIQRDRANGQQSRLKRGNLLLLNKNRETQWEPFIDGEAKVEIYEDPRVGCRYVLAVDVMEGEMEERGSDPKDRDGHSAQVWRQGYFHPRNRSWFPPKMVARSRPECQWDVDVLAEVVHSLSVHYQAITVPEVNVSPDLLIYLKQYGTNLWRRRSNAENRKQKVTEQVGWRTTKATRKVLIGNLASAIREWDIEGDGCDMPCLNLVRQCERFIVKENGRVEAMEGERDDDVIAAGIAITCLPGATTYRVRGVTPDEPRDIALMRRQKTRARGRNRSHSA